MAVTFILRVPEFKEDKGVKKCIIDDTDKVNVWVKVVRKPLDYRGSTNIKISYLWYKYVQKDIKPEKLKELSKEANKDYTNVYNRLNDIKKAFEDLIDADLIPSKEDCKELLERLTSKNNKPQDEKTEEKKEEDVLTYCKRLVERMKAGTKLNDGEEFGEGTIKNWNSFSKLLTGFVASTGKTLFWRDINKNKAEEFSKYLKDGGYSRSTQNRYIKVFKALINNAEEDGITGTPSTKILETSKMRQKKDEAKIECQRIWLTEEETQALVNAPLKGAEATARDVFCFGIACLQRVSDYSVIKKEDFEFINGIPVLHIIQKKTDKEVLVPILREWAINILEKYNYTLPKIADVNINRYIKVACQRLSATTPSLAEDEVTMLRKKEKDAEDSKERYTTNKLGDAIRPRYELVQTHTARRTGARYTYKHYVETGIITIDDLREWLGHSKVEQTYEYIGIDPEKERRRKLIESLSKLNNQK